MKRNGVRVKERKENEMKRNGVRVKERKENEVTSHPRIAHGQRYPMLCLE